MPALLALLLAAAGASAQEREAGAGVSYALASTTLPHPQGRSLEQQTQGRVELVRWATVPGGAWGMALGARRDGNSVPQPEVGVRWRSPLDNNQRLDLSAWRSLGADAGPADTPGAGPAPTLVSTRIELQFVAPRSTASLSENGALGVQLSSDSKLSMRIRRGGPVVYYRMQF
ncbi:hypothetical protein [Azohydromonas aeria]|uniref:hypothetical protein n=1 Tax=Azohydromonas aeria TaxID=2590212 RepID=UPI0012FC3502|nr:hypothetical protein [Azohydromonas aeria]